MAYQKKTEEAPTQKGLSTDAIFKQLLGQHNAKNANAATYGGGIGSDVKIWVPTGAVSLDTIISNAEQGGWPCGRIVELYGEPGYGKSSICFEGIARTQEMGGIGIFFDIENAASETFMKAFGIDTKKIIYSTLDTVEDIFETMEKNLQTIVSSGAFKNKPVFILVDSLAAMKSKKLIEGDFGYNMGTQGEFAKVLGLALKRMTTHLIQANAVLVIVNQQRDKLGVTHGDTKFTPGGNALKFYSSLRLKLLGKKYLVAPDLATGEDVPWGAEVTVRTDKNKLSIPMRKADFKLNFTRGIEEEEDWLTYLANVGVVVRGGAWYTITDKLGAPKFANQKFQSTKWLGMLAEDPILYDACKAAVKRAFIKTDTDNIAIAPTDEQEPGDDILADQETGEIVEGA